MNVFLIGCSSDTALEQSYRRAFEGLGHSVSLYDVEARFASFVRLGKLGRIINQFVSIEAWQRKLNRELALTLRATGPDLVLVFGNARILFSTLAFVKSIQSCPFVLVWPDPLTGLQTHVRDAASLYDGVATYCRASVPVFTRLGFANAQWVPLAADPVLHQNQAAPAQFRYDLTFVGAWRPEREKVLATLLTRFPGLNAGVWGPDWNRCQTRLLRPYLHKKSLLGRQYAAMFAQSRINLNVIDDTGYPAANMRFFEIPVAQGLQLVSDCPELADTFRDREHVLYFRDADSLCATIDYAMSHPAEMATIRRAGYELALQSHTYTHRAAHLLSLIT